LKSDGTVAALPWGFNFYGPPYNPYVPPGLSNVVAIASGDGHNLALLGDVHPMIQVPVSNPDYSAEGFRLKVATKRGYVYRLEYKNSIEETDWTGLPLVAGNGKEQTLVDWTITPNHRFYRVRYF
jgi:hypothetical protein